MYEDLNVSVWRTSMRSGAAVAPPCSLRVAVWPTSQSTAHTAAALQLKKAALDHHIARVSGPDAPLSLAPQCSQFARPRCANRTGAMLFGTLDGLNMLAFKSRGLRLNLKI